MNFPKKQTLSILKIFETLWDTLSSLHHYFLIKWLSIVRFKAIIMTHIKEEKKIKFYTIWFKDGSNIRLKHYEQ